MLGKEFYIKFWGVRGTVPVPGKSTLKYGGNTSCVEVRCGGRQIIFDAGTGLHALGKETDIFHTDILLSHSHLDHIQGLPFFRPLYMKNSNVALWAGHLKPQKTVEEVVGHLMMSPIFPLSLKDVQSKVEFNDFMAGEQLLNQGFELAGIKIATLPLNHPDRATAYRLTFGGKSVCYVTDVEHTVGKVDASLAAFIKNTDILIYDSTFCDEEFEKYIGWGHSTWQQAIRLANEANVKTLVTFHHDPELGDTQMAAREKKILTQRPASVVAKEGLVIDLMKK